MRLEWSRVLKKSFVRRRYLARFETDAAEMGLAVFEVGADGWVGVTTYNPKIIENLLQQRVGVRLYRRGQ